MTETVFTQRDDNHVPSYVPIYNRLYSDIKNGIYLSGSALPSEPDLAEKYGVSRNTLRQALTILNEDRMIQKKQGKGTFITYDPNRSSQPICQINPILDCALHEVDKVEMTYNYGPPTDIAQRKLGIRVSDIILASDNTFFCKDEAVGYSFVQIPVKLVSAMNIDLNDSKQADNLVNRLIFEQASSAQISVKIVSAEENVTAYLPVREGQPLLYLEEVLFDRNNEGVARCKFYMDPVFYDLEFQV